MPGIVVDALAYGWSSARAHVEGRDRLRLLDFEVWKGVNRGEDWWEALEIFVPANGDLSLFSLSHDRGVQAKV